MSSSITYGVSHEILEIEHHVHPISTRAIPNGERRYGAVLITGVSDTQNVVIGTITYTFVTALGSPAANNVQIKIQGALVDSVKKLAEATQGKVDATNIAYGGGTAFSNAAAVGWWTSNRISIGATQVAAGQKIYLRGVVSDTTAAITLTTTASASATAMTRTLEQRYVFDGNQTPATSSIAGSFQTVIPIGFIDTHYDMSHIECTGTSSTAMIAELDMYYSLDEVTYVKVIEAMTVSKDSTNKGCIQYARTGYRIPPNAGFYIKGRSNATSASENVDLRFKYHIYPANV